MKQNKGVRAGCQPTALDPSGSSRSGIPDAEWLSKTECDFEKEMDAISTVYSLRPGYTLTQADFDAIQLFDKVSREDQERSVDAFHRGYMQGLREGGSADIEKMREKLDEKIVQHSVDRAMRSFVERELQEVTQHVRDFIRAMDRGYLDCRDDSVFIDALRQIAHKPAQGMAAGTDETAQQAQPEGQQPDPKDAP